MKPILLRSARRALAALMLCSVAALAQQPGLASDDPAERLSGYLRTLAGDPHDVTALNGAGRAALEIGDVNGALGFYGRAETAAPQNGDAKAGLAAALVQLEQPRRALPLFAQAVQLGVPAGRIAADRGLAYDLLGDNASAQRDYALALAAAESDETRRRYALSLGISGQRQKALDLLDPLVRRRDPAGWRARAFVLALTGDTPAASSIVEAMMPSESSAMQPFLVELSGLTPAQKAAAVNFGDMPSAAAAGGAGTQLAAREAMPMPVPAPVGAMLVPGGTPLGRLSSPAVPGASAAAPASSTMAIGSSSAASAPAVRQPVVPLDRSVAQAVIRRQAAGVAAAALPPLSPPPPPPPRAVPVVTVPAGSGAGPAPTRPAAIPGASPTIVAAAVNTAPAGLPAASPTPASQAPITPDAIARPLPAPAPASTQLAAIAAPVAATSVPPPAASAMSAGSGAPAPGLIGPPAPAVDRLAVTTPAPPAAIATTDLPASSPSSGRDDASPAPSLPAPRAAVRIQPGRVAEPDAATTHERSAASSPASSAPRAARAPDISAGVAKQKTAEPTLDESSRSAKTKPSRADSSGDVAAAPAKRSRDSTSSDAGHAVTSGRKDRSGTSDGEEPKLDRADRSARVRGGTAGGADVSQTDRSGKTHDDAAKDREPAKAAGSTKPRGGKSRSGDADDDSAAGKAGSKSGSADGSDTQGTRKTTKSDSANKSDGSSERVYVQVAGGANKDDMDKAWAGVKKQAPSLLKGRSPSTTPLRFTNRLLVGPFKDADEAQGFVNKLAGKGVSGFVFKSARGQKIEKVDTAK